MRNRPSTVIRLEIPQIHGTIGDYSLTALCPRLVWSLCKACRAEPASVQNSPVRQHFEFHHLIEVPMKNRIHTFVAAMCLAAAVTMFAAPSQALAQSCGYGFAGSGGYGPYGWGFGGTASPYAMGRIPTPPYFALHPPVYYSTPVPRTFGYSPFAYSGNVRTPEVVDMGHAQVLTNPYVTPVKEVKPAVTPAKKEEQQAIAKTRPRWITNPHVESNKANQRTVVVND